MKWLLSASVSLHLLLFFLHLLLLLYIHSLFSTLAWVSLLLKLPFIFSSFFQSALSYSNVIPSTPSTASTETPPPYVSLLAMHDTYLILSQITYIYLYMGFQRFPKPFDNHIGILCTSWIARLREVWWFLKASCVASFAYEVN